MKKYFATFSVKDNSRLKYRAVESGWFDEVLFFSNYSIEKFKKELDKLIDAIDDDDVIVYADEFSELNLNGYDVFKSRLSLLKDYDAIISECNRFSNSFFYLKKTACSHSFLDDWTDGREFNNCNVKTLKPDLKCLQAAQYSKNYEFRLSGNDILPHCRLNYYKPYAMFVAGHVLPYYECDYDMYTHFINVGADDLKRCSANSKENIKEHQELAELTALYWIWRNVDVSDLKFIGFSTYRKPFFISNQVAYDMLSSKKADCIANRFYCNFNKIHRIELGDDNVELFKLILKEKLSSVEYEEFMTDYETSKFVYMCTSFIMNADRFNEFCSKVFSVVISLAEQMKERFGRKEHRPCAGCFAEAVTSFFIKKMFKNVFTAPFLIYPLYKQYFDDDRGSYDPLPFGTMNDNGKLIFMPTGEHPFKIKGLNQTIEDKFISDNDNLNKDIRILKNSEYLVSE